MWWIIWSWWPQSHAGMSLKFHLWRWCDVLTWRVPLSADLCCRERLKPGGSSVRSLTRSLLAMLLSVQRLCHLSFVSKPESLKTFAEPQKGLRDLTLESHIWSIVWVFMDWKLRVGFGAIKLSQHLCLLAHTRGWEVIQAWEPLHACWFQCTADYPHQYFWDNVQVFRVAGLYPNRRTVFCCRVHKSKAGSVKSARSWYPDGAC